jgi:mono/diheme cytochrome c family protein
MRSLSTFRTVFIIVVCLLTLGSMRAMSQTPAGQAHVGEYTQSDITRGSQLYAEQCAVCHGLGGNAVFSVDLRLGRFRTAVSDDDLKRVVRSGVPTAGMPPSTLGDQGGHGRSCVGDPGFGGRRGAREGSVRGR